MQENGVLDVMTSAKMGARAKWRLTQQICLKGISYYTKRTFSSIAEQSSTLDESMTMIYFKKQSIDVYTEKHS